MSLTAGDHSAGHVRRIVRAYLEAWHLEEMIDSIQLGTTELLANVVRHVPGRRCDFALLWLPWGARVEVSDGAAAMPRMPQPAEFAPPQDTDELDEGGRGLILIDGISRRWGVVPLSPQGKTVWFECETKHTALP
ncbi:ATP-binding protein [Streptomyces sp. CAU 1734]|uniref:ATP-binding protein n=1 Tax=Streptomyces sp. CAU 1734 TaxID=3140360 RepID=UPI003260438D